jgi:hypothetical protein
MIMCFGGGSEPRVIQKPRTDFQTITTKTPDVTQRVMEAGSASRNSSDFGSTLGAYSNPANLGPGPASTKKGT